MGAILLNGCRIGTGSIVAAGALVPEGMVVPPGSMVMGMPAKVRRPLTAEEDASIQWYADNYVRYRLEFQDSGAAIGDPRDSGVPDPGVPTGSRMPDPGSRV
jgi:carbonic anhydrase/acetyltransferase-like protein (isoleucine patch superfamily)